MFEGATAGLKGVLLESFPNFLISFSLLHSYVGKGYCQIEGGTAGIVPYLSEHFEIIFFIDALNEHYHFVH